MLCPLTGAQTIRNTMSLASLRPELVPFLEPHLPKTPAGDCKKPFVTLTYAQSLDSRISRGRGLRTAISHPETKTMTHYLRYHHDGILVGSGTVLADNPGLNCKWAPEDAATNRSPVETSPRPVVLDPGHKWRFDGSKMQELFASGQGRAPIVVVNDSVHVQEEENVTYLRVAANTASGKMDWLDIFLRLRSEFGMQSVMVEGGAVVINELLGRPDLVDSLVVTVGATYLGKQGVEVSPPHGTVLLTDVDWWRGTRDAVLCARLEKC